MTVLIGRTAAGRESIMSGKRKSDTGEEHLRRVRRICSAMPECTEKLSHGEPTFFVRKKVFAMFANNHHDDDRQGSRGC